MIGLPETWSSKMKRNIDQIGWRLASSGTRFFACCLMLCVAQPASAQVDGFPSRAIQIVVPFPAGGSADFFARVVGDKLGPAVGQPVIIQNKPGAGGIIGTSAVIASAPDGHTLLVPSVASITVGPSLVDPVPFTIKDVAPISAIATVPAVLVIRRSLGLRTFADLLKFARENPGKINIATAGRGTIADLAALLLEQETGTKVTIVAYRGSPPAVTDLLGDHVDIMFSDVPFFLEHIKAGKLIPLAIGTTERSPSLPDVPTTAELGYPKLVAANTYGLFAPGKTPAPVVQKLNHLVTTALQDQEVREALAKREAMPAGDTPGRFAEFVQAEADRWIPIARAGAPKTPVNR
jgi:tripartite-type tricarboxylate transporter receptor subunit TctC